MSSNPLACNVSMVHRYLDQQLSVEEEIALEAHLEQCEACQRAISDSAAEADWWQQASRFLPSDQWDHGPATDATTSNPAPPATTGLDGAREDLTGEGLSGESIPVIDGDTTGMLSRLTEWLDPTDDPRMLGRFGGYEILGVIGHGGMGVVLKRHEPALNRYVAIKVLAPHLASSGAARQRFSREAKAAAAVLHENVIAIHRVEQSHGLPYLVMPYVSGVSLQKRLDQDGPLPLTAILRIGRQIAAGLAAAHAQGIVHRDIKPANILLERGVERVTLTDFGLARAVDDATMTTTGVIAGTPQYMSPEQARGESLDARSDLFSLGSVLYAMCTARSPFRAETSYGILRRINDSEPRPIHEINVDIPAWLEGIIGKLHAKLPEDRFQSAAEVTEILEQCLAYVQQPHGASLPQCVSQLIEPALPVTKQIPSSQLRVKVMAVAAAVAMMLVLLVIGLLTRDRKPSPGPIHPDTSAAGANATDDPLTAWDASEQASSQLFRDWLEFESRVNQPWGFSIDSTESSDPGHRSNAPPPSVQSNPSINQGASAQ